MTTQTVRTPDGGARADADPYEPQATAFITACGGDPRQAVIALMGENDYLASRIEALEDAVSWGYVRAGAARR
ncbi:hypothetical protein [Nitratireductor sp. OM-1]|uniref:hypothetical protein n=1 Tax=Nitratireductor sp. OM-1 TaxID=1756988 RepID=UPI000DDF3083|nr:hypothetical protein [Nitratireductor sp. OM-1]